MLGYVFAVGQETPSRQVTRVYMPSNYGDNILTYTEKISNGAIDSVNVYHPQGIVETSSTTSEYVGATIIGYQTQATTMMPEAAAFQLNLKTIDSVSSSPVNASLTTSVFGSGNDLDEGPSVLPLSNSTYIFGLASPFLKQNFSTFDWEVAGASFGFGMMSASESASSEIDSLTLDALAVMSSYGANYRDTNAPILELLLPMPMEFL